MLSKLFHAHYFISYNPNFLLSSSLSCVKVKVRIIFFHLTEEIQSLVERIFKGYRCGAQTGTQMWWPPHQCSFHHIVRKQWWVFVQQWPKKPITALVPPWLSFLDFGCPLYTPLNGVPHPHRCTQQSLPNCTLNGLCGNVRRLYLFLANDVTSFQLG